MKSTTSLLPNLTSTDLKSRRIMLFTLLLAAAAAAAAAPARTTSPQQRRIGWWWDAPLDESDPSVGVLLDWVAANKASVMTRTSFSTPGIHFVCLVNSFTLMWCADPP